MPLGLCWCEQEVNNSLLLWVFAYKLENIDRSRLNRPGTETEEEQIKVGDRRQSEEDQGRVSAWEQGESDSDTDSTRPWINGRPDPLSSASTAEEEP